MITCGWCGQATDIESCVACRRDPVLPWRQRGQEPPPAHAAMLARAEARLRRDGRTPTIEAIAEVLDVSPRTVRRWRGVAR